MPSYKFRVLIDTNTGTDVFRDIVIGANDNLERFYKSIIQAFDFRDDQMASFYKSNDEWDKGQEITLVDMGFSDNTDPVLIMSETKLSEVITEPNQKLILVHDFMRMWCFLIELVETISKNTANPQVVLAVGDAPDESSKELDGDDAMIYGETLDLGDDFDDIFSDGDDDFDDEDLDGFSEDQGENEYY